MSHAASVPELSHSTLLFFAPFYNRSGYGITARGLVAKWHRLGVRLRIVPVGEVEAGIDDFDMDFLKSLESTPITSPVAAVFFHVPSPVWLTVVLPPGSLRIMFTTFDSSAQGNLPPADWVRICNQMDQLWLSSEPEVAAWVQAGMAASKIHIITPCHSWLDNQVLPPVSLTPTPALPAFRFLSIGMFQPRRRWDTLIEAFLTEFKDVEDAELFLKVNYPPWHPVPGKPKRDLHQLINGLRARLHSKARITLDESMGTRRGICELIDACDVYVTTDTCVTAPLVESNIRGRGVLAPGSYCSVLPAGSYQPIQEVPDLARPMTDEMLEYQPHHRGKSMPLLRVADVRAALRVAFERPMAERRVPWKGWEPWLQGFSSPSCTQGFVHALIGGFQGKVEPEGEGASGRGGIPVRWEGPQFVYHSLAHVNRQVCLGLIASDRVELSLIPHEFHQCEGADVPSFQPLVRALYRPLAGPAAVHVRHQWPPNFEAPPEGAWVVMQPWEYGGIPKAWIDPLSRLVDEVWVPTSWVRDRYIESGVPEDKVVVVPNGVDTDLFTPEGPHFPLKTRKGFRFLFLGGTIPRKGIDVLLGAYTQAFRAGDDVCLVIKGQAGEVYQGHDLSTALEEIRRMPDAPEIEYRLENLEEAELAALYRTCHAFAMPYRGEGFGLPIAEAMASGLPVIVPHRGAAMDFVGEDSAYLIPSRIRPIPQVDAFEPGPAGFWVEEPDALALAASMRRVYESRDEGREKGLRGRERVRTGFSWARATDVILERVAVLAARKPCRFSMVSRAPVPREALLFRPDFAEAGWAEVLVSYLEAFSPGEPVALLLALPSGEGAPSPEAAQELVLSIITRLGRETFPDLALVESTAELDDMLRDYGRAQWIPKERGAVAGLAGWAGLRFARARERLSEGLRS